MRLGWAALPLLAAVTACSPARKYQEAARSLRFTLEQVEPDLQLAFPLVRSRIGFNLTVGVQNPSTVAFHLRTFEGTFRLELGYQHHTLGQVTLLSPLDLPAGGEAKLKVNLAFSYRDLAGLWPDLEATLDRNRPGAWELDGTLRGEVYGFPVTVPVRTRRTFGAAPQAAPGAAQ
jgi:hypothetical protein